MLERNSKRFKESAKEDQQKGKEFLEKFMKKNKVKKPSAWEDIFKKLKD